jgi:hypothetical protein
MKDKSLQDLVKKHSDDMDKLKKASAEERDSIKIKWAQDVIELKQMCGQLEGTARCLSDENDELKRTLEHSKFNLRGFWEQFEGVDKEAKHAKCEIETLKLSIQSLEEQCTHMQQELESSVSRNQELHEQAKKSKQEEEARTDELRKAEKQLVEAAASCERRGDEIQRQRSIIAKLELDLRTVQQQLQQNVGNIEEIARQTQAQLRSVQVELSRQHTDAHAVKLERDAMTVACERAQHERKLQGQKFHETVRQLKEVTQEQMVCVLCQIDDVDRELASVKQECCTQGQYARSLLASYCSLDLQHSAAQQSFASSEQLLKIKVAALEKEQRDQVASHDKTMSEMSFQHIARLRQQDEQIAQLTAEVTKERQAKETRIRALYDAQTSYRHGLTQRDDIIAELRKELSVAADHVKTREAKLRAVSEEIKEREAQHKQKILAAFEENERQLVEMQDLRRQCGDAQAKLQDVVTQRDALTASCGQHQTELAQLRAKVANLKDHLEAERRSGKVPGTSEAASDDISSNSFDKRSSFGNVLGVFSNEQDKKMRELERSLTRLISENSDHRRSQLSLQWQLAALEKLFTIFKNKHHHFVDWSRCHVSFLCWRYVHSSSSDNAEITPRTRVEQAPGFKTSESNSASKGSDSNTASCESFQTAQSYMMQYSQLYNDDDMRSKAHRLQQHVANLRANQLTVSGMVRVRIRLRFISAVLLNWRLYMISRLHCLVVTRSIIERRRAKSTRITFDVLAVERSYKAELLKAEAALRMIAPRILIQQHFKIWLHEVERLRFRKSAD